MTKPLFRWIAPADGHQRSARTLVDHCVNVQRLFHDFEERRMNVTEARDSIEAMSEIMAENGIEVLEPRWFAKLLAKRETAAA